MAQVIKTTFKFRRNSASYWAEKNPVLAEGEPCFELDTGKLKVGDGTSNWSALGYLGAQANVIEAVKVGGTALEISEKAVDITEISTDLLKNGTQELIIDCGGAADPV